MNNKKNIFLVLILIGIFVTGCTKNDQAIEVDTEAVEAIEIIDVEENDTEENDIENTAETNDVEVVEPIKESFSADALMPEGWELVSAVTGDLNNDGIGDLVQIIEQKGSELDADSRKLQIAFGVAEDQYIIDLETDTAILIKEDGGVWGEPLDSLLIEEGQVIVNFFGGSNYRWYGTYVFSYEESNWVLVRLIQGDYYSLDLTQQHLFEYKLLTGAYHFESANYKGDMIPYEGVIKESVPIPLETFDIYKVMENISAGFGGFEVAENLVIDGAQLQSTLTVRNVTFYRPHTVEEATLLKLDYDGVMVVNGVRYITFDWIEGDDSMEESYDDSLMTAESYGKTIGLRVASIDELTALIEAESFGFLEEDTTINYGWPRIYWTCDKGGG